MKKKKLPKPRNAMAFELVINPLFRTRIEKSDAEKRRHLTDQWDRTRKHKGRRDHPADLARRQTRLSIDQRRHVA